MTQWINYTGLLPTELMSATNPSASVGVIRLGNLDKISWRNFGNTGDLNLSVNTDDRLSFNGELAFRLDKNAASRWIFTNGSAGAAASADITLSTDAGDSRHQAITIASGAYAVWSTDSTFTNGIKIITNGARPISFQTNAVERIGISGVGNVSIGTAALATNATDGFLYMPSCAGTPSGTPTGITGRVPWVYDSTNNKIYIYNGAWKATAALT